MADVQILAQGTKAAPLDYVVPQTSEILLRAAGATFDGTGAAGAFLPAIVITPPSGVPLPPFVTDTAVAAGSSAEVVFAPFLRNAPAAAASADTVFAIAYRSGFNVPLNGGTSTAQLTPWDFLNTSGADIDLDGSGRIRINTPGLYLAHPTLQVFDSTWTNDTTMLLNVFLVLAAGGNSLVTTRPGQDTDVGPNNPTKVALTWEIFAPTYINVEQAPEVIGVAAQSVTPIAGHVATNTFASMSVHRLGPSPVMSLT